MRHFARKSVPNTQTEPAAPKSVRPAETGGRIRDLLFFVLFYLYLWQVVDLRLIAHGAGIITNFPAFYTGWTYFERFLSYPGGIVEYVAAFLSQLFYVGWAGPAVATAQVWLTCAATDYVLKRFGLTALRPLRFVPALLGLATYAQYSFHFVTATALTVSLLFVCLYLRLTGTGTSQRKGRSAISLSVFVVLSVILYTFAGGAYLVFAALVALYEAARRRSGMALAYLLIGAVLLHVEGVLIFDERPADAYGALLPYPWEKLALNQAETGLVWAYVLYLLLPSVLVLAMSGQFALARLRAGHDTAKSRVRERWVRWTERHRVLPAALKWTVATLALAAVVAGTAVASYSPKRKTLFEVDYYACHEMWPQVLQAARGRPRDMMVVHAVNRALYHTGRLPYDAFAHPQHPDALLQTGKDRSLRCWHKFDTLVHLGLLNLAEKNLAECAAVFGEHPLILERLALINLAKDRIAAARIYLHRLTKTLFHNDWARDTLVRLDCDPNLTEDPRVSHLRRVRLNTDSIADFYVGERMLQALLESNPHNRMAFEYLTTSYLLNRQLKKFIDNIARLNDFEYGEVPRIYQEALLIYMYGTKQPVYLPGRTLDPQRRRQIEDFSRIYNSYGRDKRAAIPELTKRYSDSYFFYHIYRFSPGTR